MPVKHFAGACYDAARRIGGRVVQVQAAYKHERVCANFHEALLTLGYQSEKVRVVCNAHYPMVAFASPAAYEGDLRLQFVDCAELAEALRGEFAILSSRDVHEAISSDAIKQLGKAELREMRFWKAHRIGELVFNYWD